MLYYYAELVGAICGGGCHDQQVEPSEEQRVNAKERGESETLEKFYNGGDRKVVRGCFIKDSTFGGINAIGRRIIVMTIYFRNNSVRCI